MDIVTAFIYHKCGYRIRRPTWGRLYYYTSKSKLAAKDVLANDWEIITSGIIKDFPITYRG